MTLRILNENNTKLTNRSDNRKMFIRNNRSLLALVATAFQCDAHGTERLTAICRLKCGVRMRGSAATFCKHYALYVTITDTKAH